MPEGQDIDALLVGALYGELTPAEQARLTAHLEARPADRKVLENLRATRDVIRGSAVMARPIEPPPGVSALLLQEAARRAPKRVADGEPRGWLAKFFSSFVAHPALASVASLVLVVGVAGTLYLKSGGEPLAEKEIVQAPAASPSSESKLSRSPPSAAEPSAAEASTPAPSRSRSSGAPSDPSAYPPSASDVAVAQPPATEPSIGGDVVARGKAAVSPAAPASLTNSSKDAVRVDLDDGATGSKGAGRGIDANGRNHAERAADKKLPAKAKQVAPSGFSVAPVTKSDEARAGKKAANDREQYAPAPAPADHLSAGAANGAFDRDDAPSGGSFATAPKPAMRPAQEGAGAAAPSTDLAKRESAPQESLIRKPAPAVKSSASKSAAPARDVPAPPTPTSQASMSQSARNQAPVNQAPTSQAARNQAPTNQAPTSQAARNQAPANQGLTNQESTNQAPTSQAATGDSAQRESSTWSRTVHQRLLALVKAGKCQDAAPLIAQLKTRVPDYYADNVAGDRSLGPCLAAIAKADRDAKAKNKAAAAAASEK